MAERDEAIDVTPPGHYGAAGSGVTIGEVSIAAQWNVQGDPARGSFIDEVRRVFDIALPTLPNSIAESADLMAIWLGPQSWLLSSGRASRLGDFIPRRDAINAAGGALFDVSASRAAWAVSGPRATTVLAKSCPLDFHPRTFPANACAQSLFGHVNALYIKHDDAPTFSVLVARSFARDVIHTLVESAAQYGLDVGPPQSLC